jgi:hypothetical protein
MRSPRGARGLETEEHAAPYVGDPFRELGRGHAGERTAQRRGGRVAEDQRHAVRRRGDVLDRVPRERRVAAGVVEDERVGAQRDVRVVLEDAAEAQDRAQARADDAREADRRQRQAHVVRRVRGAHAAGDREAADEHDEGREREDPHDASRRVDAVPLDEDRRCVVHCPPVPSMAAATASRSPFPGS